MSKDIQYVKPSSGNILYELLNNLDSAPPEAGPVAPPRADGLETLNGARSKLGGAPPQPVKTFATDPPCNINSSILSWAVNRSKRDVLYSRQMEETTPFENFDLSRLSATCAESVINAFKPRYVLKAEDANFTPVDVACGPKMTLAASPISNQVVVFQDRLCTGTLKLPGTKYFNKPRNILYIPTNQDIGHFLILDESGVRIFNEGGKYLSTLLKEDGYQYRGLAFYRCIKKVSSGNQPQLYIVLLKALVRKARNSLSVFEVVGSFESLEEVQNIPISDAYGDPNSRCRFVAVSSNCSQTDGCRAHLAFVTDTGKTAVYKVNLISGQSCIAVFEGDRNLDVTFGDLERSKKFSLIAPTGITIDGSGNIFVADRDSYCIELFAPNGMWLRSLRIFCRPLGIEYDNIDKHLLVVDQETKNILIFKFSLG